jgi:hypothetical protein
MLFKPIFPLLLFVIFVPLSGICGAWIHASISRNIFDPEVREQIRREWSIQLEDHNRVIERAKVEEREWQEKKERREREEAERVEKEKLERGRMRLYWDDIQGDENCLGYGTRKYGARLANLLPGIDAIEACKATPITIHDATYESPDYCEDRVSHVFVLNPNIYLIMCWMVFIRGSSEPAKFMGIGSSMSNRSARLSGSPSVIRLADSSLLSFYHPLRFIVVSGLSGRRFRFTCMLFDSI